jgi:hypothetical protein
MENNPTRKDHSLPERIKSLREMINRRDIQFERIRDELVIEMKESIKGIELLEKEKEELNRHRVFISDFLQDFYPITYFKYCRNKEDKEDKVTETKSEVIGKELLAQDLDSNKILN